MELGLKSKSAIVTGGAKGIGAAIVAGFVKEGVNVVIGDIDIDAARELSEQLGNAKTKVLAVKTDVTQKADADEVVSCTVTEFGKIDILVNDAAFPPIEVPFDELEEKDWDRTIDVSAKGTFLVSQAVVPHMKAARNGKIINLSSSAGMRGFATVSAYCVAKFGVRALTQVLALELAEYNINVNALAPGIVRTPLWECILDAQSERGGEPRDQIFNDRVAEALPLNRPQEPEDISNLVMFLSSDISRNITGETININGGQILG